MLLPFKRVDVGVSTQPISGFSAQEHMDRLIERLPDNVPTGDLQARKSPHNRWIGTLAKACGVRASKHLLDVLRGVPLHVTRKDILDHGLHRNRADRGCIDLAVSHNSIRRGELHKDEIPTAPRLWRCSHNKNFKIFEFHRVVS